VFYPLLNWKTHGETMKFGLLFYLNNQPDALINQIYSVIKLYMFRASSLPIVRSFLLYIRHWWVSCRNFITASKQSQDEIAVPSWSCSIDVHKLVGHAAFPSVQWINSWWWTEELPETCRVLWQNKFVKLVHLVGFITNKFLTMHGHINVKELRTVSNVLHHAEMISKLRGSV